jgi:uncharacterized protein YkwD
MRYLSAIVVALVLAGVTAIGVSALDAGPAEAASGGKVRACGGGKISLNANELKSFKLHNQTRKQRGVRQLCVHPKLQKAARAHSRDMLEREYFAHGDTGARLRSHGYDWRTYGENIGYNSTPERMHNAWMNSEGHRKNILNSSFREIGIGAVTGDYDGFRTTMYTADFGSR